MFFEVYDFARRAHRDNYTARAWQKHERLAADMKAAAEGVVTQDQLSWFSGGRERRAKVIGAPY